MRATPGSPSRRDTTRREGEPYTHTHFLRNNGLAADTYTLALSSDRGWSTLYTPSPVSIEAGETVTVEVVGLIPESTDYALEETVYLTATSHSDPALVAAPINRTRAGLAGGISLPPARSSTVTAGERGVYTHNLSNDTNASQTFVFTGDSAEGYDVTVAPTSPVVLSAFGGSVPVTVSIETPVWEISGTVDLTVITATGSLGSLAFVTDTTSILEPDNYLLHLPLVLRNAP